MMRFKSILLLLLAYPMSIWASDIQSVYITNANGLSNSSVTCIYQDSRSLVWLGTWDGLNLFDGRDIRTYKYDPYDPNTLSNNIIREVAEQRLGIMWVATDHGVNRIDMLTNRVERFYFGYEQANPLTEHSFLIASDGKGSLFCAVRKYGLAYYDENTHSFVALNLPGVDLFDITGMYCDSLNHNLWLLNGDGHVYYTRIEYSPTGKINLTNVQEIPYSIPFRKIFAGGGNHVILQDDHLTLCLVNPQTKCIEQSIPLQYSSGKGEITSIIESDTTLQIAFSIGGVYRMSFSERTLISEEGLERKAVLALRQCSQNILWVGTDGQGVIMRYQRHRNFGVVYNREVQSNRNSPVRSFCTDSKGILWVGTKGDGIYRFNQNGNHSTLINRISVTEGLSNNSVYCIIPGLHDDLMAGTDGSGIDICSSDGNRISKLDISLLLRNNDGFGSVYSLWLDQSKQILWAGTSGYGLIRMHLDSQNNRYRVVEYKKYKYDKDDLNSISNNTIYTILPCSDGSGLWIGTRGGGLNRLDFTTEHFKKYRHNASEPHSLSSNDVLSLSYDTRGNLWIGTGYGLNRMENNAESGKTIFTRFTERDGLPNNTIHGIVCGPHDILWISTNRGISRFHPSGEQPINYTMGDGLQNNEFSDGAYWRSRNGTIYFGGISGFNFFIPDAIRERSFIPRIGITEFKVFNDQRPEYNDIYFSQHGKGITLDHDQSFFSIGFVAFDFIDNRNCEYAYRLDGFDREWVIAGVGHNAVYTNVPPGRYTFRVRSTNSDKMWCENELSFPIRIRFPWWSRWWAFILYGLAGIAIGFLIYRIVRNRMRFNRELFLERLAQHRQQEIHEAKLRFFTNIAHEFCTPLTLIYGPCEKLLEKNLDEDSSKYVRIIRSNATRMQGLIAELMDFRKAETGHRALKAEKIDVGELISCIIDNFAELNRENRITLTVSVEPENLQLISDRDSLEKIVFNLISNAYKYTPTDGSITLAASRNNTDGLILSVTNTGKGIQPEDVETVFDRFKILDNFERQASRGNTVRNGIGLALTKGLVGVLGGTINVKSEVGYQTQFTVVLPPLKTLNQETENITSETTSTLENLSETTHSEQNTNATTTNFPSTPVPSHGDGPLPVVLVVDDEPQIRELLTDLFAEQYHVLTAANGQEAIERMKHQRPDLIVSDIIMPVMDGPTFVAELKSNPFTAAIPVIFLTSKTTIDDRISGYEQGIEAYISKPFHPRHLLAVANQLVSNRLSLKNYYNSSLSQSDVFNGNIIAEKDKEFIVQLNHIIEENLQNEQMDLAHIASALAISRMQFYRKIKELTGSSPSEYIRLVKLDRAAHLLRTTEFTVQEIMYQSGFNNKSYFYREFSTRYNCSPKEYKSNLKQKN